MDAEGSSPDSPLSSLHPPATHLLPSASRNSCCLGGPPRLLASAIRPAAFRALLLSSAAGGQQKAAEPWHLAALPHHRLVTEPAK